MIWKILKIFFVLFWMGLIFYFSMDSGIESTKKSDGIIIRTSEILLRRKLTEQEKTLYIEKYQVYVRKTAHFTLYFFLGLSILLLLKEFHLFCKKDILVTILLVFLYACSDEIHQLFISERSGEILDVLLDTFGGVVAVIIYFFFNTIKTKKDI